VPKNGCWYGEHQDVISFVTERFQSLYNDTWSEFQQLVKDKKSPSRSGLGEFPVDFEPDANASGLAPQAAQLLAALRLGPIELSEGEARELLIRAKQSGILRTKQDPWRVFLYYRRRLEDSGVLEHTAQKSYRIKRHP
jgi:hypothetical protein